MKQKPGDVSPIYRISCDDGIEVPSNVVAVARPTGGLVARWPLQSTEKPFWMDVTSSNHWAKAIWPGDPSFGPVKSA